MSSLQLEVLKKYWGYSDFRLLQNEIIQSVLDGKDTLALLPTGGGKSICFQVPALVKKGICIVVSPLIALMQDQVENLTKRGIAAVAVTGELSKSEIENTLESCVNGEYKFLYISPERLKSEDFKSRLKYMNINLLAVDESHCISQWGYDFRPDYLQIAQIKEYFAKPVPTLAVTASATPNVVKDIQKKLHFKKENILQKSFERKNLFYMVLYPQDKNYRLLSIINKIKGSGVVYVGSRRRSKEVSDFLNKNQIQADFYHAGLPAREKQQKQKDWQNEKISIIVATNAFGMGIDKSNVRFVVHMNIPSSIEAYFQEAGRAGRDGNTAYAVLLAMESEIKNVKKLHYKNLPTIKFASQVYDKLMQYLRIPLSGGIDQKYPFTINNFCTQYNFMITKVFKVLKILENEGILLFSEKEYIPSKVQFLMERESLFHYYNQNPNIEEFCKTILRSYTEITVKPVRIDENKLAKRVENNIYQTKNNLNILRQHGVIEYIPAESKSYITMLQNRDKNLPHNTKKNIEIRNQRDTDRILAMLDYVVNIHKCRNIQLLQYFGERQYKECTGCDVCLKKSKRLTCEKSYWNVEQKILGLLKKQSIDIRGILAELYHIEEQQILEVLRKLIENKKVKMNSLNHYQII